MPSLDSAYAEAQPPPPPVMMLISVTDLHPPKLRTLAMHEDLPDKFECVVSPPAAKDTGVAGKADKALAFAKATPTKAKPGSSAPTPFSRQSAPPLSLAPADPGSPLSDMSDDESDTDGSSDSDGGGVTTPKIACPTGLTRRTLTHHKEFVHKGDTTSRDDEIAKLTAYVQRLAKRHLDLNVALSFQDDVAVKRVFNALKDEFPNLKQYAKDWPAKCLLQAHLKVTSDAAKNAVVANFRKEVSEKPSTRKRANQVCVFFRFLLCVNPVFVASDLNWGLI
ncbi:hypothetical protein C8R44DRAFT_755080 [Mycena epipterygia]|nr:hypothetical protein C8R44DRAFT_755080 [Mycena epipterygia]